MTDALDQRFMRLALALGARGLGKVWPRPAVGCVLVRDGQIVGRGWTDAETSRHGERVALDQAGHLARGATAYVTLEPCSHHGRTPPCADALIAAGVSRVVVALGDPNPQVNGAGIERLRNAGIVVDLGLMEADARLAHHGFLKAIGQGLPMVTLKLAATLDGRIATATGESRWITGPEARRSVHAMRARHDAVLIGGGTARADDPDLRVRDLGVSHQPVRVVMTRRLDLPLDGRLAQTAKDVPLWLIHGQDADASLVAAWAGLGARLLPVEHRAGGHLDPRLALGALAQAGITRVFCEGGGMLAAGLLQAGLVDELVHFSAGRMIGAEGQPMIGVLGVDRLTDAPRFDLVEQRKVGMDIQSTWRANPRR